MKCRPLSDRLVVECIEADKKTRGGIIIPDTAKEKPKQGRVVAVGPGTRDDSGNRIPVDVAVGDTVLFSQWSGVEIDLNGRKYLVMKESDIIGRLA